MAIYLTITWKHGTSESMQIGTYHDFVEHWAPLAGEIGLKLVTQFHQFMNIDEQMLPLVLDELDRLIPEAALRKQDFIVQRAAQLRQKLMELQPMQGWTADIG